jgi:hypothetical protein
MFKRVVLPLSIFLAWLTVVGIGASAPRYSGPAKTADLTLLTIELGLVAFLSVLVLRDRRDARRPDRQSGATLLRRIRAWITDDGAIVK